MSVYLYVMFCQLYKQLNQPLTFAFLCTPPGVLSSPQVTGSRPPPCQAFTLTSVEPNRAVLFGGFQPECGRVDNIYLFNIDTKVLM